MLINLIFEIFNVHMIFSYLTDQVRPPVVWTGDFNTHNPLWGSRFRDVNGVLFEDFKDKNNLVVLFDGRPARFQVKSGSLSCLGLNFTSGRIARCGNWYPMDLNTLGSDHFLVNLEVFCMWRRREGFIFEKQPVGAPEISGCRCYGDA